MKYGIKGLCWYDEKTDEIHEYDRESLPVRYIRDLNLLRVVIRVFMSEFLYEPYVLSIDKCNKVVQTFKSKFRDYKFEKWE